MKVAFARMYRIACASLVLLSGTLALSLNACSSSDSGDGTVVGRIAWGQASGSKSTIYMADIEFSLSSDKSVNTKSLAALTSGQLGAGPLGTVVINDREVKISSVVFAPSVRNRPLAQGVNLAVTRVTQVSHGTADFSPSIDATNWDHIYFHRAVAGLVIWLADVATGEERIVANGSDPNASTNNRLLWADRGIRSRNIATGEERLVLAGANYDPVPFTGGGKRLIFFNSNTQHTGTSFTVKSNFVLNESSGVVTKITSSTMKEDNPTPDPDGKLVAWHGWPEARGAATVYYGKFDGRGVSNPIRLTFHDENGALVTGNCWYVTWTGSDMITFMNGELGTIYVSDLQGNARKTGLIGSERDFAVH